MHPRTSSSRRGPALIFCIGGRDEIGYIRRVNTDTMTRFAATGETLDPELRSDVLALGPGAIPELLRLLNDDGLQMEDSPGAGWPPIHAVELLAELKATEAVEPMLRLLCETSWDHIIHDRLVSRMHELGPAVVEPALAVLNAPVSEDVRHALCCVLAKVGVRDPRIFEHLCTMFDESDVLGAGCLADYGDPAAQPILAAAIEDFVPEFGKVSSRVDFNELVDAFHRVGGVMNEQLRAHVTSIEAQFKTGPLDPAKPGRNDACPCGSGKKFKRCCL